MGLEDPSGTLEADERNYNRRGGRWGRRMLAYIATAAWTVVLLAGLGYGALVQHLGDAYCEPFEGSSQYGELRWSAFPPGPTCTFTADVHGFDAVRGPYPVMSTWLLVLAVGGAVCIVLVRRSRASGPVQR